jgi:hypothetical protein
MAAPRLEQAAALVADVQAALAAADLPKALATLDANKALSASRHGAVIVGPPDLTFPTWGECLPEFELHVIAGPAADYLAAWDKIDQIIEALALAHINLASGKPGQYQPLQGPALPCYTLTLNPLD